MIFILVTLLRTLLIFVSIANSALQSLRYAVDNALSNSFGRSATGGRDGFVAHITLTKGVPFYGYHVGNRFFLKIYLFNPAHVTRLADLLRQGAIMEKSLQPYEAHLQFIPQWMCDYNLYGCSYMRCDNVHFRSPVPPYGEVSIMNHRWHDGSIPPENVLDMRSFPKQSHCDLEVDIQAHHILNRREVAERPIHQDFDERFLNLKVDQRLVPSMHAFWEEEARRRRGGDRSSFRKDELIPMSVESRTVTSVPWVHEEENRIDLATKVQEAQEEADETSSVSFDNFLPSIPSADSVPSTLEAVEALYPDKLRVVSGLGNLSAPLPDERVQDESDAFPSSWIDDDINLDSPGDGIDDNMDGYDLQDIPSDEVDILPAYLSFESSNVRPEASEQQASPTPREEDTRELDNAHPHDVDNILTSGISIAEDELVASEGRHKRPISELEHDKEKPCAKKPKATSNLEDFSDMKSSSQQVIPHSFSSHDIPQITSSQSTLKPEQTTNASSRYSSQGALARHTEGSSFASSTSIAQMLRHRRPIRETFSSSPNQKSYLYRFQAPSATEVTQTLGDDFRPSVIYQQPYYSNDNDVPDRPFEYAGRTFKLRGNTVPYLPPFDPTGMAPYMYGEDSHILDQMDRKTRTRNNEIARKACTITRWEFAPTLPTFAEVKTWFEEEQKKEPSMNALQPATREFSQIEGPTQKASLGLDVPRKRDIKATQVNSQYMSVMSLEVHVNTRGGLSPDPEKDQINCIFFSFHAAESTEEGDFYTGIISLSDDACPTVNSTAPMASDVFEEPTELDVLTKLVDVVRLLDPDILAGYEVHNGSWGYVIERARYQFDYDFCSELSRVKSQARGHFGKDADRWGYNTASFIGVTGRHIINIWRAMKSELNLLQYTIENVTYHLLRQRIPHYSFEDLTTLFNSSKVRDRARAIRYHLRRVRLDLQILDASETVSRTTEQARLLGIDFSNVFSRGSQFKVESLMFRIAKPENFLLISPSRRQVASQNALECLPLVMEPLSNFYTSPVLVLDFQSLYPSVMIAYNYCYSTCLGRVRDWRGRNKMGFIELDTPPRLLKLLENQVNISPNGIVYVKPEIRQSLLAKMLIELIETRSMVKGGMKEAKDDKRFFRLLNNRQLALKLIANVTFGYTSASFSGRMPCSDIGDSIVQSGREILEKSIAFIHSVEKWGAEVVYGDTDSLFVNLKGRSREEAFKIGREIVSAVTDTLPRPIKLQFQKVYHPCVLLAKKRYVGNKYEKPEQQEPIFDAKGIETIRRDGTPAVQKIEEKALKLLFETADLSQIKEYFQKQCGKIMRGKVSAQDFSFARAVRLGTYSVNGLPPPGALISARRMLSDPRREPQYGERVPYVVINGAPWERLADRCVSPEVLLNNPHLTLDAEYYITKTIIPPLERIFNLVGANVRQWYDELPRYQRIRHVEAAGVDSGALNTKRTLESYMKSQSCIICARKLTELDIKAQQEQMCSRCISQPQISLLKLRSRLSYVEKRSSDTRRICQSCIGCAWGDEVRCDSQDCPVFYSRVKFSSQLSHARAIYSSAMKLLTEQELGW